MSASVTAVLGSGLDEGAFLGVERSVGGRCWRLRHHDDRMARAIAQTCDVPDLIARLLASRGQTPESVPGFLNPRLREALPDPEGLRDMDRAASRLARAVANGEAIALFGDYDVDGATSAALISRFLAAAGARVPRLYVPDRMSEGYGPNPAALRRLKDEGIGLAVTLDCGITAFEALDEAAAIGLEVIVVDHHVAEPRLPAALAIINPNRLDETFPHRQLAAVGVAYLLVIALNRALRLAGWYSPARPEPDLMAWLDLVALGTICDVVPLTGLNRALVAQGLKVLAARSNTGVKALCDVAGVGERLETYHAGFILGPRVNAGGRVGQADLGSRLLSTDDPGEAAALARSLDAYNKERRQIEAGVLIEAERLAEREMDRAPGLLFLAGEGWHQGVIGIVAGRLKDRYQRPVCVIAIDGKRAKASGRSIAGVDLGSAVIAAREAGLVEKGGGHAMAAGFELDRDRLERLREFLEARVAAALVPGVASQAASLALDGALQPMAATPALLRQIQAVGPFGSGNAEPRFALPSARVAWASPVGADHVRCTLTGSDGAKLKAIAFRALGQELGQALLAPGGRALHVAGKLKLDTWQGREEVQLQIEDAALAGG